MPVVLASERYQVRVVGHINQETLNNREPSALTAAETFLSLPGQNLLKLYLPSVLARCTSHLIYCQFC